MSKELEKQVALLSDAELVKWASLFAQMSSLHAEMASLNTEFQSIAEALRSPDPAAIQAEIRAELKRGCVSFFCAACLLGEGGRVEPGGGTLAKRKGVVQTVKERESKMQPEDLQQRWKEQGEEATAAVAQWRMAHSKATLAEIEQAVDEQINLR